YHDCNPADIRDPTLFLSLRRVFARNAGFFFIDPATTQLYTLSLHDALPIFRPELAPGLLERRQLSRARPAARQVSLELVALERQDRKSTRLNSSHVENSYAVFCLKKKKSQFTKARCVDQRATVRQYDEHAAC